MLNQLQEDDEVGKVALLECSDLILRTIVDHFLLNHLEF